MAQKRISKIKLSEMGALGIKILCIRKHLSKCQAYPNVPISIKTGKPYGLEENVYPCFQICFGHLKHDLQQEIRELLSALLRVRRPMKKDVGQTIIKSLWPLFLKKRQFQSKVQLIYCGISKRFMYAGLFSEWNSFHLDNTPIPHCV